METAPEKTTPTPAPTESKATPAPKEPSKELITAADKNLSNILSFDTENFQQQSNVEASVRSLGLDLQREVGRKSSLLQTPIRDMETNVQDGDVATTLVSLRDHVSTVNPNKFDLSEGFFTRVFGFLPFVGKPLEKYMVKFRTAESIINEIVNSLKEGQAQLDRDNVDMDGQKIDLQTLVAKLVKAIDVGEIMSTKIEAAIEAETDPAKKKFLQERILFTLRQRLLDLGTVLNVAQQGILSMNLLIDTNRTLIQNVERTATVTIAALRIGATIQVALQNQKRVLEATKKVNEETNSLIEGNARALKENAGEITKQATESTINIESLKRSFNDITTAMDDVERYKLEALPRMKDTIKELGQLNSKAADKIEDVEKANKLAGNITLELE